MGSSSLQRRQRLSLLFFAAFLLAVYSWVSARRVPWSSGMVRILVLEILPPGIETPPGLLRWNDQAPSADASLDTAADWLARQYAAFVPSAGPLDVRFEVSGPHRVDLAPPDLNDPDLAPIGFAWRAFQYYLYFRGLSAELGADFGDYDARVVVILERREGDVEAASMGDRKQRFGVVHLDPEIPDPNYACITFLHELGHTLGASDKYDPQTFLARWPEGYADPRRVPVFPQVQGEIMAVDVPLGPTSEREPTTLREIRVGARTAAELGWIPHALADSRYEGLPPRPR